MGLVLDVESCKITCSLSVLGSQEHGFVASPSVFLSECENLCF